jgi:hypothetical protein
LKNALVAGWFSFQEGHATAGDLFARDVACEWLREAGYQYDIALAPPFQGGVDWRQIDPDDYSHVVFVCGPFQRSRLEVEFLEQFASCRLIGLNLSMHEHLSEWNPFDLLLERDSSRGRHPDMAFLSAPAKVPVVGVCRVEPYPGGLVSEANEVINRLIGSRQMAVVEIDTRLDAFSANHLRSAAEIESLIARVEVMLTTRLHGLVLALKNGIPPIAIDPEPGGAKIHRQAKLLGWPASFIVDQLDDLALQEAFQYCLTDESRVKAKRCCEHARRLVVDMGKNFVAEIMDGETIEKRYQERIAAMPRNLNIEHPGHADSGIKGSVMSWRHRLKLGLQKIGRRRKNL